MIRGIERVVRGNDLVAGAFYLYPRYSGEPYLIQAIGVPNESDDEPPVTYGLVFDPGADDPLALITLDASSLYVLMPDVSIRIDPPSASGNSFTHAIRRGIFFVADDVPYAVAAMSYRGYSIVDLSTGTLAQGNLPLWVMFDRWQLVVDENGEEIPIASFGVQPSVP